MLFQLFLQPTKSAVLFEHGSFYSTAGRADG